MIRKFPFLHFAAFFLLLICLTNFACFNGKQATVRQPLTTVQTLAGTKETRFGEAFGIAASENGAVFISDGAQGKIWEISKDGAARLVTDKLDTPSGMAIEKSGSLVVADAGSHTIKRVNTQSGEVSLVAGTENRLGFADGAANQALFNAPVGVAVDENGKIYVADTYNDRIRTIENGDVKTVAGGEQGFADGGSAKFNTPCGIAVLPGGEILVADTGNRRIRKISAGGATSTFAGTGEFGNRNGLSNSVQFIEPVGVTIDRSGAIYVADAGANQIKVFGQRLFVFWETLAGSGHRGLVDSKYGQPQFNRPTNVAVSADGEIFIADSANKSVRAFSPQSNEKLAQMGADRFAERDQMFATAEQLRKAGAPLWTYAPQTRPRDVAGTFGELRGQIKNPDDDAWFHNGLDIAGGYGETALFIRDEKVLRPLAVEDFDARNNRERLRMPTIGYIHIRLGRDQNGTPFNDDRFLFSQIGGKPSGLRIRRGTRFKAGEPLGTLNPFNHVHLIAGETGAEMNAFAALELPGAKDTIAPKIEKVTLFDENWREIKTNQAIGGKIRITVRSFDQMDGGSARRKLGVYKLGYEVLKPDGTSAIEKMENISFERLPDNEFANLVYGIGSQSGYTPETIFNYIVTNVVKNETAREDFLDTTKLPDGDYRIRVFAADFFGNEASQELNVKVSK